VIFCFCSFYVTAIFIFVTFVIWTVHVLDSGHEVCVLGYNMAINSVTIKKWYQHSSQPVIFYNLRVYQTTHWNVICCSLNIGFFFAASRMSRFFLYGILLIQSLYFQLDHIHGFSQVYVWHILIYLVYI
jgi:hypothetical protein